ncbi:hypothetical protein GEV33_004344 [Tenebrio molitor]|uniref:Uncharacterized protein n=1 Tax=Tenebrio molitor TaxID=7067 RepID=A0A8J6HPY5_TENMO|nr:hypothetical protein GEV33_004344 [Tenebrio molitor]
MPESYLSRTLEVDGAGKGSSLLRLNNDSNMAPVRLWFSPSSAMASACCRATASLSLAGSAGMLVARAINFDVPTRVDVQTGSPLDGVGPFWRSEPWLP